MSTNSKEKSSSPPEEGESVKDEMECAVCLQDCIHPVKLPCSHIFCFLCVKGVMQENNRCALCRQEIPAAFLENPILLKKVEDNLSKKKGHYQWFYEGWNGWWQYDERTNADIEAAYGRGCRSYDALVAGILYTIDFDRMIQYRRNDLSRQRRIKRDLSSIHKKGIAGLKTRAACEGEASTSQLSTNNARPSAPSMVRASAEPLSRLHDSNSDLPRSSHRHPRIPTTNNSLLNNQRSLTEFNLPSRTEEEITPNSLSETLIDNVEPFMDTFEREAAIETLIDNFDDSHFTNTFPEDYFSDNVEPFMDEIEREAPIEALIDNFNDFDFIDPYPEDYFN